DRNVTGVQTCALPICDIQKATDIGAVGIIVPTVDMVEKAQAAVKWSKYPPEGRRSQGNGQYGALWGNDYRETANENMMVVIMIRSEERRGGKGGSDGW